MGFQFCDKMIADYATLGYTIFRRIVPTSLLTDMRRATVRTHQLAREQRGPQAQRLQPVVKYFRDDELKPMVDFLNLPPLVDAVHRLLSPRHELGGNGNGIERLGIFVEPEKHPCCTNWHRDLRETSGVPDVAEFRRLNNDPLWFNQFNAPLYEDNCTWYVPGSYHRAFDLPEEAAVGDAPVFDDSASEETRECGCLEYCYKMPGGVRLNLDAGDFALYHPNGWHIGNYLPGRKRLTLHGYAPTPELLDWYARWRAAGKK